MLFLWIWMARVRCRQTDYEVLISDEGVTRLTVLKQPQSTGRVFENHANRIIIRHTQSQVNISPPLSPHDPKDDPTRKLYDINTLRLSPLILSSLHTIKPSSTYISQSSIRNRPKAHKPNINISYLSVSKIRMPCMCCNCNWIRLYKIQFCPNCRHRCDSCANYGRRPADASGVMSCRQVPKSSFCSSDTNLICTSEGDACSVSQARLGSGGESVLGNVAESEVGKGVLVGDMADVMKGGRDLNEQGSLEANIGGIAGGIIRQLKPCRIKHSERVSFAFGFLLLFAMVTYGHYFLFVLKNP